MWTADEICAIAAAKHQDLAWRQNVVGVFGSIQHALVGMGYPVSAPRSVIVDKVVDMCVGEHANAGIPMRIVVSFSGAF